MKKLSKDAQGFTQRQRRVGEEVRQAIAHMIERGELPHPILDETPVTITEVRISPDLRNASVYLLPLGGKNQAVILDVMREVKRHMKHQIGQMLRLRYIPELTFHLDTSFFEANRIEALLNKPEVKKDLKS